MGVLQFARFSLCSTVLEPGSVTRIVREGTELIQRLAGIPAKPGKEAGLSLAGTGQRPRVYKEQLQTLGFYTENRVIRRSHGAGR